MLRPLVPAAFLLILSGNAVAASPSAVDEAVIFFRNLLTRTAPVVPKTAASLLREQKAVLVSNMLARPLPARVKIHADELLVGVTCDSYAEHRKNKTIPTTADIAQKAAKQLGLMQIPVEEQVTEVLTAAAKVLLDSYRDKELQISLLDLGTEASYKQQCVQTLKSL